MKRSRNAFFFWIASTHLLVWPWLVSGWTGTTNTNAKAKAKRMLRKLRTKPSLSFLPSCSSSTGMSSRTRVVQRQSLDDDYTNVDEVSESTQSSSLSSFKRTSPTRRRRGPIRRVPRSLCGNSSGKNSTTHQNEQLSRHEQASQDPTLLSSTFFYDLDLPSWLARAIRQAGYEQLTQIQAQTFAPILQQVSLLARAKTGSGKTLAYLVPTLERLMQQQQQKQSLAGGGGGGGILILVPTRELAQQIAAVALDLLQYAPGCDGSLVYAMYGGTSMISDRNRFRSSATASATTSWPIVLVATPGRFLDHVENTRIQGKRFADMVKEQTSVLILDEVDQLLDNFGKELDEIIQKSLPRPQKRQTLLFSATIPKRLHDQLASILPADYLEIDTTIKDRVMRIEQSYLQLSSMKEYVSTLINILNQEMQRDTNYKVLVFFPAARLVRFFADALGALDIPVLQMHSRLSQSARKRAKQAFESSQQAVMLTSDVSARGVDYPDVSLVVQYGAPFSTDLATHRVGRTGRAGREGRSLFVLLPFESASKKTLVRRMRPTKSRDYMRAVVLKSECDENVDTIRRLVQSEPLRASAESAYSAFVAYYEEYAARNVKGSVILDAAGAFAEDIGLSELPPLPERVASKLQQR